MQVALSISYHNIGKSQGAENAIRARVARLEKIDRRIASCRVHVSRRAYSINRLIPPSVRIELRIPGSRNLVVSHEPGRDAPANRSPDLHDAIEEAFRLAERSLRDLKIIHATNLDIAERGDLGFLGEVTEVYPLQDYGYLRKIDGSRLYFHRDAIVEGDFDYLVRGAEAYYVEDLSEEEPKAVKIWVRDGGSRA
jgi:ribosome-associated translation inhibitor RaiA